MEKPGQFRAEINRVGICCYVSECRPRLLLCDKAYRLRMRSDLADAQYVAWMLNGQEIVQQIEAMKSGISDSGLNLKQEAFLALKIPLPPLAEQRRIVARIVALFARTRRARADLERIAPLGHHLSVVSTELALRNAASTWTTIGELATVVQYGTSAKTEDDTSGIPVLRMGNIVDGKLHLGKLKYLPRNHPEFPSLLLEPGDILFNRTNSAELVGKTAVYLGEPSSCSFASYLIRLRIKGLRPQLLAAYINSPAGREWAASVVSQQVGQANINGTKLRAFRVPVMPEEIQRREENRLLSTSSSIHKLEVEASRVLALLDRLEQSILARAFRGELVIPHAQETSATMPVTKPNSATPATRGGRPRPGIAA
jgi:type I restriction enzyme S subunit